MPGWADAPGRARALHRAASPARVPDAAAVSRAGDVGPRDVYRAHRGGRHGAARVRGRLRLDLSRRARGRRSPGRGGEAVVSLLIERDGRRLLRPLDKRCPERTVYAGNETDIRGAVVLVGNTVSAPLPASCAHRRRGLFGKRPPHRHGRRAGNPVRAMDAQ